MTMRPATNADVRDICRIVSTVLDEYGLHTDCGGTDADLRDIESSYFLRGGHFAVMERADKVIGTVGLVPISSDAVELRKMYLLRDFRGDGLGRRLLEYALDTARSSGYGRVTLETSEKLVEAVGLYRKYGFEPYEANSLAGRSTMAMQLYIDKERTSHGPEA